MDNSKWANAQVSALIAAGVNPIDAQQSVTWVLDNMPVNSDPSTWIPSVSELNKPIDGVAMQDALSTWFLRAPTKYKRLLSATVKRNG